MRFAGGKDPAKASVSRDARLVGIRKQSSINDYSRIGPIASCDGF